MSTEKTLYHPDKKERTSMGIPEHVLIIPDNNRTWAKNQHLTIRDGYNLGAQRIIEVADAAIGMAGLNFLTINLVSADNLKGRSTGELTDLWDAIRGNMIDNGLPQLVANEVKIRTIGRPDDERIPEDIREGFKELSEHSKDNTDLALTFVVGYHEDLEMQDALDASGVQSHNAAIVRSNYYLPRAGLPDINLVVRTGEAERTSGIFPYGIAHAEFAFVRDRYWPEFTAEDFGRIVAASALREQKGGK